jgi:hypothetical protein
LPTRLVSPWTGLTHRRAGTVAARPVPRSSSPAVPSRCHCEHDASGSPRSTTDPRPSDLGALYYRCGAARMVRMGSLGWTAGATAGPHSGHERPDRSGQHRSTPAHHLPRSPGTLPHPPQVAATPRRSLTRKGSQVQTLSRPPSRRSPAETLLGPSLRTDTDGKRALTRLGRGLRVGISVPVVDTLASTFLGFCALPGEGARRTAAR